MASRWLIHRPNGDLGPYTSEQVRDALRDGHLNPFDKVSRSGSNIRQELIEVDEIFTEVADFTADSVDQATEPTAIIGVTARHEQTRAVAHYPSPSGLKSKKSKGPDPKLVRRYLIVDKGKQSWGPFSARDIMSFYNRGALPGSAKIKLEGSHKLISAKAFVTEYVRRDRTGLGPGKPFAHWNVRRIADAKLQSIDFSEISYRYIISALLIVSGMLCGLLLMITVGADQQGQVDSDRLSKTPKLEEVRRKVKSEAVQRKKLRNVSPKKKLRNVSPKVTKKVPKKNRGSSGMIKQKTKSRRSGAARVGSLPRPARVPLRRDPPKPVVRTRPRSRIQKRAIPPPQQSQNKGKNLRNFVGKIVTTGPASFSRSAVVACSAKCKIRFREGNGQVFTGVFFKSAYQGVLTRRRTVRVTGTVKVKGNQVIIFVQGLR